MTKRIEDTLATTNGESRGARDRSGATTGADTGDPVGWQPSRSAFDAAGASGKFPAYNVCGPVDLDTLPAAVALSPTEIAFLRTILATALREVAEEVARVALDELTVPQDERLAAACLDDLAEIHELRHALTVTGVAQLRRAGWDTIDDRPALIRIAAAVGNEIEGAHYNDDRFRLARLQPLAIRLGLEDAPKPPPLSV